MMKHGRTTLIFTQIRRCTLSTFHYLSMVRLAPNLTIKPLGEGINLVAFSCGCGANMCYNTAGCPGT